MIGHKMTILFGPFAMFAAAALAQAIPDIGRFSASNLTTTGILAYFAWYVLNRTLPELRKDHIAEVAAMREEQKETRLQFAAHAERFQCRAFGSQDGKERGAA